VCGNGNFFIIKAADNKTFTPQHASVAQGQSICFENTGSIVHSVVADSFTVADSTWKRNGEQGLAPGFPVIINVGVGDYYYHCGIHGFAGDTTAGMWGKITVR
jgi:plastocyanin